jgi:3-oxoacyl-[acyl-carrier protein] reductase
MDLGITGRTALVCASSKGLGRGCAEALAAEGVDLVLNARGSEALEATCGIDPGRLRCRGHHCRC